LHNESEIGVRNFVGDAKKMHVFAVVVVIVVVELFDVKQLPTAIQR
jgi:hypothetical protein